jgi:hypothetical protein
MNTEITGLTLTEWLFMIGLTLILGVWAYFNHSVIVTQNFGRIDPILLASMLTPGFFFFIKHGETYLRAKGKQALTNQGSYPIMRDSAQAGGEVDIVHWMDKIALPQLKLLKTGISKPTIPTFWPLKYIGGPEKHMMDLGGCKIIQSDVSRYDGEAMRQLILNIRSTLDTLPGIVLDEDSLLFGDNLESSWPRHMTHGGTEKIYIIPSTPVSTYNVEIEHSLNAEVVGLMEMKLKLDWSISKLKGRDFFGGM